MIMHYMETCLYPCTTVHNPKSTNEQCQDFTPLLTKLEPVTLHTHSNTPEKPQQRSSASVVE